MTQLMLVALLGLAPAHAARPVCGDGDVRGGEECDGAALDGQTCQTLGYDTGSLGCQTDCTFDVTSCSVLPTAACGDGVVEGYEECDGAADAACPSACSDLCACPATSPGDLEIHVIDVGQGDGVLIVSPDGFAMLVDAGTNAQDATVASYMASIGLSSLDYVLVTHMDSDHVGGMDGVLTDYP